AGLLTCQTILLVLIGLLVSISTNQAAAKHLSNVTQPRETPEEELAALKLDMSTVLLRYSRLRDNYASLPENSMYVFENNSIATRWHRITDGQMTDLLNNCSSRDNCTSMGGHLSILHSKSAHPWKKASRIGGFNNYFWIGLSDREMEGDWRWVGQHNPDNNTSGGVEGEDCVVLQSNTHAWSDVPCEFIYPRICQMDAFPITSS
uniref:C-type lectin domain-containing protein n=1 Tax=Oncorhynchus tshawytscha TaxID=74940 RepID=A0A8C8LK30_ONCTS